MNRKCKKKGSITTVPIEIEVAGMLTAILARNCLVVDPLIFNIKQQELTHCILWIKLS